MRTVDPAMTAATDEREAARLRSAMTDEVVAWLESLGVTVPADTVAALRAVRRHAFLPGVALADAYANDSVVTKVDDRGVNLSAVSAPSAIFMMLAQAGDLRGKRVLEIGSGGYNAALLAELVGSQGAVTTMDIDAQIVDRARFCLDRAGYPGAHPMRRRRVRRSRVRPLRCDHRDGRGLGHTTRVDRPARRRRCPGRTAAYPMA